jgi:Arc/MetJ-type ribon-helix-helix transcriptional regulator
MQLNLKPETQKFIEEQITAGRFRTSEELVDEAVSRMMIDDEPDLDEGTLAAIKEADEQFSRGEYLSLDEVKAQMQSKISTR